MTGLKILGDMGRESYAERFMRGKEMIARLNAEAEAEARRERIRQLKGRYDSAGTGPMAGQSTICPNDIQPTLDGLIKKIDGLNDEINLRNKYPNIIIKDNYKNKLRDYILPILSEINKYTNPF